MIVLVILLLFGLIALNPRLDHYKDYRDMKHLVIWFNWFTGRKFIHYEWSDK